MKDPTISEQPTLSQDGRPANGAAPIHGQGVQSEPEGKQPASPQGQGAEIKPEDILGAMRFQRSPEEEAERLRTEYAASTKEAQRLNAMMKAVQKALADEQGIDTLFDKEGKLQGFKANERYSKEAADLKISYDELTDKQKQLLADDPEKGFAQVVESVIARAKKAYTRVTPTVDKIIEPLTEDRFKAALDFLGTRKDSLAGEVMYPELGADAPILAQVMNDPSLPKAIKDAAAQHPDIMLELLYAKMALTKQRLTAWAKKKAESQSQQQQQNRTEAEVGPEGAGRTVIAGNGDAKASFLSVLKSVAS